MPKAMNSTTERRILEISEVKAVRSRLLLRIHEFWYKDTTQVQRAKGNRS